MKRDMLILLAFLVLSPPLEAQEKRPSLLTGRAKSPPLLSGRSSHMLGSSKKMKKVRRIYIAPMENRLNFKLAEAFLHWGRFEIVATEKEADAVIVGTCFAARRLKTVKSDIYIRTRRTREPLWHGNLRLPYNPPKVEKVVGKIGSLMVDHLRLSMQDSKR